MHSYKKLLKLLQLCACVLCLAATASAEGIQAISVQLVKSTVLDDVAKAHEWDLQASFGVDLPQRVADLAKATPIYFVLDWRMTRPRWYWRDERLAQGQLFWRLSFNPITQQWRMSAASTSAPNDARFSISYASLDEALNPLRKIRRENLVQPEALQSGDAYEISVRLRLDTASLPKPFQINAITNRDWALDSGILVTTFVAQSAVNALIPVAPAVK